MKEIALKNLEMDVFDAIGNKWMLITAAKADGSVNTMTASWGGLGVLWGKNVAFAVIRKSRFTKEFVDEAKTFSLSFLSDEFKSQKAYLGTVSGRDEEKIKKSGLKLAVKNATPYFAEADEVFICKKMFVAPFSPESFVDSAVVTDWYKDGDFHDLYIGEIISALK